MRILTFLTDPPVVSAILLHLDLPTNRRPSRSPAGQGHPREAWVGDLLTGLLDQTPAFDPAEPDPIPELPTLRSGEPAAYRIALRHYPNSPSEPRPRSAFGLT